MSCNDVCMSVDFDGSNEFYSDAIRRAAKDSPGIQPQEDRSMTTTEQLEKREAGPDLDREVCRALGWASMIGKEEIFWRTENGETTGRTFPPVLSTNIAHAFEVVRAMRELPHLLDFAMHTTSTGWCVEVYNRHADGEPMVAEIDVEADTLPHAICLAALDALEATTPQSAVEVPHV